MLLSSADFGASFISELVGLAIVIALFVHYGWPRLRALMDAQAKKIADQLSASEEAAAAGAALVAQREEALSRAKLEASEIVAQARRSAEALIADGERRATEEYARLVARAAIEIERGTLAVRNDVTAELASVVLSVASDVVRSELDLPRHHVLIGEAISAAAAEAGDAS